MIWKVVDPKARIKPTWKGNMRHGSTKAILIINRDPDETRKMAALIEDLNLTALTARDADSGYCLLRKHRVSTVFLEMNGDRFEVIDFLGKTGALDDPPRVIVITERASPKDAEAVMKEGAHDFWIKPIEPLRLRKTIQLFRESDSASKKEHSEGCYVDIVTQDETMERLKAIARRIAPSNASVFIQGESGTGKELFARYIHQHSDRCNRALVAVNCAALPENLLESELFGYEKGAFTGASSSKKGKFELAHKGTLLLDEITEIPVHLQAKLLRVLQMGEVDRLGGQFPISVDVRVIATTNVDVGEAIRKGRFRKDLYYRLNVIPLKIPPLRERRKDIPVLCEHFLRKYSRRTPGVNSPPELTKEALQRLLEHWWPGNVRELENVIQRAVLLSDGNRIKKEAIVIDEEIGDEPDSPLKDIRLMPVDEMERLLIHKALKTLNGNRTRAAEVLGISVRTLRNKLQAYRKAGRLEVEF